MKTLGRLLFIAAIAWLLFACNKSSLFSDEIAGVELRSGTVEPGPVHIVSPNGVDDTQNLKDTFKLAVTQAGSVVQLVEGVYHLNFIEIREFNGKFQGAGKGKTIITPVGDLDVDALISQNLNTILIRFVGGDVSMSNMTVMTPPGALSKGSESKIDGLTGFSGNTYTYSATNESINAVIDNVEFIGHWENCNFGLKAEYGIRSGIKVTGGWPLSKTNIKIMNCLFRDFLIGGALIWHINGGNIIVGTKGNGNIFNNNKGEHGSTSVGYGSLGIWMNINVAISVVDNLFNNPAGTWFGIDLWRAPYSAYLEQVPQTKTTVCNIERNVFNAASGSGGIKMNDRWRYFLPADAPMLVEVKNNKFNMNEAAVSGIECYSMSGTVIRNNRFSGSGSYGILLTAQTSYPVVNENGLILGNNFSDATFSGATIMVQRHTKNWTIVGGGIGESVLILNDPKYPNSNILVTGMNVNTSDVPLGQTIKDNLEEMREGMK